MSVQQASSAKVSVSPINLEDAKEPPLNLYKPKQPYTATIVSVERIVGPKAPGETCHIVIDHGGNVPYWEGQSYGVIPPVSYYYFLLKPMFGKWDEEDFWLWKTLWFCQDINSY